MLEETLNTRYAPTLKVDHENAVEIRDNPASPTGFDIHFVTVRVGARFDVKGHLTQEQLDVLQNPAKCNLLQPGTVLRISPPYLLARSKRPDGGEERIREVPDLSYLRATAQQLQQFFNHPLIRRTGGTSAEEALSATELHPEEILEMQVIRHPKDKGMLIGTNRHGRPVWFAENWPDHARYWFPSIDHPSDKATVDLSVTAPEKYDVVGPGRLVESRSLLDGRKLTRWSESVPIPTYCMVLGAAELDQAEEAEEIPAAGSGKKQDVHLLGLERGSRGDDPVAGVAARVADDGEGGVLA